MQGLKEFVIPFITDVQGAALVERDVGRLDHIPKASETRSVCGAGFTQDGANPRCMVARHIPRGSIRAVPHQHLAPTATTTTGCGKVGYAIHHARLPIAQVGPHDVEYQGDGVRIREDVPFAAFLLAIRGVGPGLRPAKTARIDTLWTTKREASICPACPRPLSHHLWRRGHTPARIKSCIPRQHVTPLPQPSSARTILHGMPVCRTYSTPVRQARSGVRGRRPWGLGGSEGKSGSISFPSSSETIVNAITLRPYLHAMRGLSTIDSTTDVATAFKFTGQLWRTVHDRFDFGLAQQNEEAAWPKGSFRGQPDRSPCCCS